MQTSIWNDIQYTFRQKDNIIAKLILVNVGVFIAVNLLYLILFLFQGGSEWYQVVINWLALPSSFGELLYKPWTLLTYMFMHEHILHILFNMLILYWFARIFQSFVSSDKILPLFVYGGLAGALLTLVSYHVFPVFRNMEYIPPMIGASAGVMAFVVAAPTLVPNYTIYLLFLGAVRIKYIAAVLVVIDLLTIPKGNSGGHIAHLGGALFGFLYVRQMQREQDWSKGFNRVVHAVENWFSSEKRIKVTYRNRKAEERDRYAQARRDVQQQEQIDIILDKIAQSGYDSLSQEEKEILFRASKDD